MKTTATERAAAIAHLRKLLKPGDTVYTLIRNPDSRGVTSKIDLFVFKSCGPICLTYSAAIAAEYPYDRDTGKLKTSAVSDVVYNVGRVLWPNGFKLPKGKLARHGEKPGHESDGGYALRHEIL